MLAFGGEAISPMTTEQLESLPSPGDMANAAIAASSIGTLQAAVMGSAVPPPPPLVEDGRTPSVPDAPAPDDDSTDITDEDGEPIAPDGGDAQTLNALPVAPIDMMARATAEVDQQAAAIMHAKPAKFPPLVSMVVCAKAAKELKAMSCSLVTQISGYPEGCECRMKAKKCPAVRRDLGFTGVSPSVPLSPPQLGGATVMLCMYWQWLAPQDRSKENADAAEEARKAATALVNAANTFAEGNAKVVASAYYGVTAAPTILPTTFPIPGTPAPIMEPVRFLSTTPYMPFFPSMWAPGPAPFPFPAPAPAPMFTPFMPVFAANGIAFTTLMTAVWAGANTLPVMSQVGFAVGQQVIIDEGRPNQEVGQIVGFGSLVLMYPLRFTHNIGATIKAVAGAPGPAPGPYPGPAYAPSPAGSPYPSPSGLAFVPFMPFGAGVPAPAPAPLVR